VRVARADVEITCARLLELVPRGFEEIELDDGVEFVVYAEEIAAGPLLRVFPDATDTAVEPGWEERWREFHRPVLAGGLWIGPSWETAPPHVPAVVIDPGRAFGTGAHPTTRLCVDLLAAEERGSLVDLGCGSGVLSVAAAMLGFDPIIALDLDPTAVACTGENVVRNGLVVETRVADALHDELPACDLAVANIELAVVEALLPRLRARRAIVSGYLAGEAPAAQGWSVIAGRELEGWAAHTLEAS
jgi:ribosomal protein L11 methyltransferase